MRSLYSLLILSLSLGLGGLIVFSDPAHSNGAANRDWSAMLFSQQSASRMVGVWIGESRRVGPQALAVRFDFTSSGTYTRYYLWDNDEPRVERGRYTASDSSLKLIVEQSATDPPHTAEETLALVWVDANTVTISGRTYRRKAAG
jgi:hypothetical protein